MLMHFQLTQMYSITLNNASVYRANRLLTSSSDSQLAQQSNNLLKSDAQLRVPAKLCAF